MRKEGGSDYETMMKKYIKAIGLAAAILTVAGTLHAYDPTWP